MENNPGLMSIQKIGSVYNFFQEIVGANRLRHIYVDEYLRPKPGDKIVDIGCGPAQLLRWLPQVNYIGFDVHRPYIETAQKKYPSRGLFLTGDTRSVENDERLMGADLAACFSVLHHLDNDEALRVVKFARKILKPGGRLVCEEPCWVGGQGSFSKMVMSIDRGKNIRTEQGYLKLMKQAFPDVKTSAGPEVLRLPIVTMVFECKMP